jgi:hypothetical protein
MDQFMKLSIYAEKVKNQDKGHRTIGSNKGATAPSQPAPAQAA